MPKELKGIEAAEKLKEKAAANESQIASEHKKVNQMTAALAKAMMAV